MKLGGKHAWMSRSEHNPAPLRIVLNNTPDAAWPPYSRELTATAFVQYCLMVDGARHSKAFGTFVERAGNGPVTEEMLKEHFGMGFARMDRALLRYLTDTAVYRESGLRGKFPPMLEAPVREATQSEVARMQAGMYFAGNAPAPALDVLRVAYWRGERDTALLVALACAEAKAGDLSRAKRLTARLKAEPGQSLRLELAEARIKYREAKESSNWNGFFEQAATVEILTLLAKAAGRTARPGEEVCELFARVVCESEGEPGGVIVDFLKMAARLYPGNGIIRDANARHGG